MKKIFLIAFFVIALCVSAVTVSANAPAPPSYFYCTAQNAPEGTVYMDILIELDPQNNQYTEFNIGNAPNGINAESPIAAYNEDGYMSLSFHYAGVSSDMEVESPLFRMGSVGQSIDNVSKTVKAVFLDKDGNILKISEVVDTTPSDSGKFAYGLTYDAEMDAPELTFVTFYKGNNGEPYHGGWLAIPLFFLLIIRAVLSVGCETLIALPFGLKPVWKVAAVNAVTQIILIVFMLNCGLTYIAALIIAEAFVYIAELIAYLLMFRNVPKWKTLVYTVTANTLTLIMGLIMNVFAI